MLIVNAYHIHFSSMLRIIKMIRTYIRKIALIGS
jgi:hypothetical protein